MKNNTKKIILVIAVICLICIAGYKIYDNTNRKTLDISVTDKSLIQAEQEAVSKNTDDTPCPISVDFTKLNQMNEDVVAWIYCGETPISFPVVQGVDNSEYSHKTFGGSLNNSGAIYLDFQNSDDFSDLKSIIYDSSADSNAPFGSILNYKNQEYYDEHPSIWLVTPDKTYKLEIISGYTSSSDSDDFRLVSDESDLKNYINSTVEKSSFKSNVDLDAMKNTIVLSVCSGSKNNPDARFLLVTGIK